MKYFIDNDFIPVITKNIKSFTSPRYSKFRFSNNNNSTDASTFHADVYNFTNNELMPIYTCLCYFDNSQLEIIPGSHLNKQMTCKKKFETKKILDIHKGDILVFHSNLHHRGINFEKQKNRRLLQVFDVFQNETIYNKLSKKLIILETSNSLFMKYVNSLLKYISKTNLINYINYMHYFLVCHNIQYYVNFEDLPKYEKRDHYISYEPGKRLKFEDISGKDATNINIIVDHKIKSRKSPNNLILQLIAICILIIIICLIISSFIKLIFKMTRMTPRKTHKKYKIRK